jgi:hypothetical protein
MCCGASRHNEQSNVIDLTIHCLELNTMPVSELVSIGRSESTIGTLIQAEATDRVEVT